jgi:hypothetical protein
MELLSNVTEALSDSVIMTDTINITVTHFISYKYICIIHERNICVYKIDM